VAYAYLVVLRSTPNDAAQRPGAKAGPEEEREFLLGWSLWRRAHQAIARRCHMGSPAMRGASGKKGEPPPLPMSVTTTTLDRRSVGLTEEEWARLRPLLPENGHYGRRGKYSGEDRSLCRAESI
jgi:hypothetical protein